MHVAIVLGNKYTYLECWQKGQLLADPSIRVKIPGMGKFSYSTAESFQDRDGMREYLYHLYREYILPSRLSVGSAAISFPTILNLSTHRMLLEVIEEILGLQEIYLIPQPLALVQGYNLQYPHRPLTGNIMVLQNSEAEWQTAFISVIDTYKHTLEKQVTTLPSLAAKEAESIGFYSSAGWNLATVLLGVDPPYTRELEDLIRSLPQEVAIIGLPDLQFTSVSGLSWDSYAMNRNLGGTCSLIYPYEFYIEKKNAQPGLELDKIPFDTANLELQVGAGYQLLTLDSSGPYNLALDPGRVNFRIYESNISSGSDNYETSAKYNLILEIDSFKHDLPGRLRLYLDLAAASLGLDLHPHQSKRDSLASLDFRGRLLSTQGKLYEALQNSSGQQLLQDFENHFLSTGLKSPEPLTAQIELTRFRLQALLHLWQAK